MCNDTNKRDRTSKQQRVAAEMGFARNEHRHRFAPWPSVYKYDSCLWRMERSRRLTLPCGLRESGHCDPLRRIIDHVCFIVSHLLRKINSSQQIANRDRPARKVEPAPFSGNFGSISRYAVSKRL